MKTNDVPFSLRLNPPWVALAAALSLLGVLASPGLASAQRTVRAAVLLQVGDSPMGAGGMVTGVNNPFTTPSGQALILAEIDSGAHVLWLDGEVIWLSTDSTAGELTTPEVADRESYGVSMAGGFLYTPRMGTERALWSNAGLLFSAGDLAPRFLGARISDLRRATMLADGTLFWHMAMDTNGDGLDDRSALMRSSDGTAGSTLTVLAGNTIVDGRSLDVFVGFDYDVSDDGAHIIAEADLNTGSTLNDAIVYIDGSLLYQEDSAIGGGAPDSWDNFDLRAINNSGDYVFSGDTNGDPGSDEFVAYNGVIAIREGDVVDGVTLTSTASVQALDIDNTGRVAHQWSRSGADELLFVADDGADIAGTSRLVLQEGDYLDLDGDGEADVRAINFNPDSGQGRGINLADDDWAVFMSIDLDYDGDGMGEVTAIVHIDTSICGDGITSGFEECDDAGESETCDADCTLAACGDGRLNTTAGESCDGDGAGTGGETADCDDDCTPVMCGDGNANEAAGEACDDGGASASCDEDCTAVMCGDSVVNPAAGEDCDDGTGLESAACDADCSAPMCGDGTHNMSAGEECDEGGNAATCDSDCSAPMCGDGLANAAAGEECDTMGESEGCDADCTTARCGDGTINAAAGETCDELSETATCDSDCTEPMCGDGVVNAAAGEACDDGNAAGGDGCSASCQTESGGCGCRVEGPSGGAPISRGGWALIALLGAALLLRGRLRRRRR